MSICTTAVFSQTKLKFVEISSGQSITMAGCGYSLFKDVPDNINATCVSMNLGWGKDSSLTFGAKIDMGGANIPTNEERLSVYSFCLEERIYRSICSFARCFFDISLGGSYAANEYMFAGNKKTEQRWGVIYDMAVGGEVFVSRHFYAGASLHFFANPLFGSLSESTSALPVKDSKGFAGNKIMFSVGYNL